MLYTDTHTHTHFFTLHLVYVRTHVNTHIYIYLYIYYIVARVKCVAGICRLVKRWKSHSQYLACAAFFTTVRSRTRQTVTPIKDRNQPHQLSTLVDARRHRVSARWFVPFFFFFFSFFSPEDSLILYHPVFVAI